MLRNIVRSVVEFRPFRPMTTAAQSAADSKFRVEHDVKNRKFLLNLDHDCMAYLNYENLGNNEVLLYHTEVPENFSGRGIGRILAQEAFKHFECSKQTMVITCPYLQKIQPSIKNK